MDKVDIGIIKTNIDKSQNTENQDFLAMMSQWPGFYLKTQKHCQQTWNCKGNIEKKSQNMENQDFEATSQWPSCWE